MSKVLCPYCGKEMKPTGEKYTAVHVAWWFCPFDGATSPRLTAGNQGIAYERAHEFALRRCLEANRVLTFEELVERNKLHYVWMEEKEMPSLSEWIEPNDEEDSYTESEYEEAKQMYGHTIRAWLRKPTSLEQAAATWDEINT